MSNTFGQLFRVTTFGESHCKAVGAVVDGCPSRLELSESDIQSQLDRRRPGQSDLSTPRQESDTVTILSGVENGLTLGTPIGLFVPNKDQRPGDYQEMSRIPRPSHADYTYQKKYGIRASSGGGRSSARETIGRVAAGAIADKILKEKWGVQIVAYVSSVGDIGIQETVYDTITRADVDAYPVRCPVPKSAKRMAERILQIKEEKDSIGGLITCICKNVPTGWGDPVFDKLEANLAHAMLTIPATKGFEIGSGFSGSKMKGSEHNDPFVKVGDEIMTKTNYSGGVQGGISNGMPVVFRVAFKPVATIGQEQETVDFNGNPVILEAKGRHDPCVLPRAVPVVEAMAALVLVNAGLNCSAIGC